MPSRFIFVVLVVAVLLASCLVPVILSCAPAREAPKTTIAEESYRVKINFLGGDQEESWDGKVEVVAGDIQKLEGWRFEKGDEVAQPNSWTCATLRTLESTRRGTPGSPPTQRPGERVKGAVVTVSGSARTRLNVTLPQGEFSFSPNALELGQKREYLEGRAEVETTPLTTLLSDESREDDYPVITVDSAGKVWVAWVSYQDRKDEIRIRSFDGKAWSPVETLADEPSNISKVSIAADSAGRVVVVWSAREGDNWDLYWRVGLNGVWAKTTKLTNNPGPDIFPRLATDAGGRIWLCWQGANRGNFDIYLRPFEKGTWGGIVTVASDPASDWEPAIAADSKGRLFIVWDTYRNGSYDVYLRVFDGATLGEEIPVAASADFEGRPSVACDSRGRAWIAWDSCGPKWGLDDWSVERSLRSYRKIGIRCYANGNLSDCARDPYTVLPSMDQELNFHLARTQQGTAELPVLGVDGEDRLWLFYRNLRSFDPSNPISPPEWSLYGTYLEEKGWSPPCIILESDGRNDHRLALYSTPRDGFWLAWPSDGRIKEPRNNPQNDDVWAAKLALRRKGAAVSLAGALKPITPERMPISKPKARYTTEIGGEECTLYYGDLHRHTDISRDGAVDGSLLDLYRYAMDAASLDFVAVTDHNAGNDLEYPWWRTQKSVDMFLVPNVFIPLFAYERSQIFPNGHRNVIQSERGLRPIRAFRDEEKNQLMRDDEARLWDAMKKEFADTGIEGITIPHTSATRMGTDWSYNDPSLERLVEIFQGMRDSYEYDGAPKSPTNTTRNVPQGDYSTEYSAGFVWNALKKGYRFGFIASSDHLSTHISFAGVYAREFSRKGLFEALKSRHTFGATDNMVIDFKMNGRFMGEEFASKEIPTMDVKVIGTGEIKQVDIIRNNKFIYTVNPEGTEADFVLIDPRTDPGVNYYYARVMQEDGNIAWGSPVWIE